MKPKKAFNRHSGFTLIEIVVAMGILSAAMLGLMQFTLNGTQSAKSQNLDVDFNILSSNVSMALSNDCTNFLKNQQLVLSPTQQVLSITSIQPPATTYFLTPASYPSGYVGIKITNLAFSQIAGPVTTSTDGTSEYTATLNLTAKKVGANGVVYPGSPVFSKDFQVDVWATAANVITTCQQASPPTGSAITLTTPPTVCPSDPISGTWSVTSGTVKSISLSTATSQVSPLTTSFTTPTSGTFSFTAPSTTGPYTNTYTLYVLSSSGSPSWGNGTPQTFTVTVNSSPPCP